MAWNGNNTLAIGTGSDDHTVAILDTATSTVVRTANTRAQTTGLHWSPDGKELATMMRFEKRGAMIWRAEDLKEMEHLERPWACASVCSAMSPDRSVVCTACAQDETIRFVSLWEPRRKAKKIVNLSGTFASTKWSIRYPDHNARNGRHGRTLVAQQFVLDVLGELGIESVTVDVLDRIRNTVQEEARFR